MKTMSHVTRTLIKKLRQFTVKNLYWPLRLQYEKVLITSLARILISLPIREYLIGSSGDGTTSGAVENRITLKLTKLVSYAGRDVRAAWFLPGEPYTTHKEFKNLARWASEHLSLYFFWLDRVGEENLILDLGGGMGNMAANIALKRPRASVLVADTHLQSVELGKALFQNISNLSFHPDDVRNLPQDMKFDCCFLIEVLEHVKADEHIELLETALTSVKPGGKVFVTTPNAIDESDDDYGHIGLLNLPRAVKLVEQFSDVITDFGYISNTKLLSRDNAQFSISGDLTRIASQT